MWGSLRGLARLLAVVVTAAVAGLLALAGAATVTARPGWFLAAGLGVFLHGGPGSPTWPATPPTSGS